MAATLLTRAIPVVMAAAVGAGCGPTPAETTAPASSAAIAVSLAMPTARPVDAATALNHTGMVLPTSATVVGSVQLDQPAELYAVVLTVAETQVERMLADSGFVKPLEPGRPSTLPAVPGFVVPSGPRVSSLQEPFTQAVFREILVDLPTDGVVRVHAWSWREH